MTNYLLPQQAGRKKSQTSIIEPVGEQHILSSPECVPISTLLPANSPRLDGIDQEHAKALAESPRALPPILVQACSMRVIDGMHRVRAAQLLGKDMIEARFFEGDDSEAFVAAVKANVMHGRPLSLADRKAAAAAIIKMFPDWSNRAVANATSLSDKTVNSIRSRSTTPDVQLNRRIGRDGRIRPVDVADARGRARRAIAEDPDASLRSIARLVGLSPATIRNVREEMDEDGSHSQSLKQVGDGSEQVRPSDKLSQRLEDSDRRRVLEALKRDPSLRLNNAGKELLRWLEMHTRLPGSSQEIIDRIPSHCVESVALLAADCSAWWATLKYQLNVENPPT